MTDAEFRQVLAACELALRLYNQLSANADEAAAKNLDAVSSRLNDIFSVLDDKAEKLGKAGERAGAIKDIDKKIADSLAELRKTFTLDAPAGGFTATAVPLPPAGGSTPQTASLDTTDAVKSLADRAKPDAEDMMKMDDFFETVSTSLMRAQQALNERSLEYVSTLDPRFPPALYGIPSVRAEMRVGFNKSEGKGINLVLFSKSSQKAQYGESTISFEVVGTPPPPGPASYGDYLVPVPGFVVVGRRRREIIAAVRPKLDLKIYTNTEAEVTVLRYEREGAPPDAPGEYLVIWPGRRADAGTDFWHTIAVAHAVERTDADGRVLRDEDGAALLDFPAQKETAETKRVESIFEKPPPGGVLTLNPRSAGLAASAAEISKLSTAELVDLVINLGDVLMNFNLLVNGWLRSVEYKPPAPPDADADKG
jgi:hypothetical protein